MDFDAASAAGAGALGLLGRALHLARADRRPLGWSLIWELPVAIGMGIVGKGLADYQHGQHCHWQPRRWRRRKAGRNRPVEPVINQNFDH